MTAALDRAVANALGLKSVNNCEKWRRTMDDDSLEDMLKQNIVRILNGREITLGRYPNPPHRIGWVWKDTGLPPTEEEAKVKRKEKNNA
jgi:hypothetical protein